MKKRPILFSAPMVRAILDGKKTVTRRVVKPQPDRVGEGWLLPMLLECPYGHPSYGDQLWVRETCRAEEMPDGLDGVRYLADGAFRPIENTREASDHWLDLSQYGNLARPASLIKTVPAIHMPHWASRIAMEVVGVKVERLQDISNSDARAEGVGEWGGDEAGDYRGEFRELWESIHGSGSWHANPWVWAIEFRRLP